MPQWSRDRSLDHTKYPDERWAATCPPSMVPLLLRYDHHVVVIRGRSALLLTYHWASDAPVDASNPRRLEVSFTYAAGHPTAPPNVQAAVDQLTFSRV